MQLTIVIFAFSTTQDIAVGHSCHCTHHFTFVALYSDLRQSICYNLLHHYSFYLSYYEVIIALGTENCTLVRRFGISRVGILLDEKR